MRPDTEPSAVEQPAETGKTELGTMIIHLKRKQSLPAVAPAVDAAAVNEARARLDVENARRQRLRDEHAVRATAVLDPLTKEVEAVRVSKPDAQLPKNFDKLLADYK